ncbi:Crp/Fnr family transcriptional regulator [Flavobacterium supellecticarium]|uniref:Crp/Fnr family transcriptional regulator n=1 Tax=Flavobacterium supellecticarium TaxID=2565924 RepID=A0A4S4A0D9_9FLAO|nr:Crp/Fnr family transcriptional regulator [Flavobacterium supellecticarium]THF51766.1 Crp/Fnr family transcriptional regulator [Flavobacterium supellecticarium]
MYESLLQLISQNLPLSAEDEALCRQYLSSVSVSKNQIIEAKGKIPEYLYFVVSGFVRLFHFNDKGDEVTTHINCPPGFITSYAHFSNQTPSDENLECITDCELLRITKADLDALTLKSPVFKDFSILIFQQSLSYNENRSKELATLTAEQRYKKLIATQPEIVHNVPVQYIASYLGMNPKSLSRIRKHIIK